MERRDIDIICSNISNWEMYRDKTILITAATGRIGRYIFESLVEVDIKYNLNLRLIGLARNGQKVKSVFGGTQDLSNVSFIIQDINEPVTYSGSVDYIYHLAGPAAPVDFKESSAETMWTHVNGMHNILEFARTHNTKRVFYVSTVEVYGELETLNNITESDMGILRHLNYRACYPEAKRLCETMLASYKEEYGVDYCGVRLSHTLGPGIVLDDGRAFASFMKNSLEGKDIILNSDGSAMRTYTYVADVVYAIFLIMDKGESRFYNVSADENLISIRDLALMIADLSPYKSTSVRYSDESANLPYLPYKLPIMDTSDIRRLGWKPSVGIREVIQWTMESFT